jgi:hypothetical protein
MRSTRRRKKRKSKPPSSGHAIDPREKTAQIKPTDGMHGLLCDRRNTLVNNGLSARRSTRDVKPKPTCAVASPSIRLDERPVAKSGGATGTSVPASPARTRSNRTIEADTAPKKVKVDWRRVAQESGVSRDEWLNLPTTMGGGRPRSRGLLRNGWMGAVLAGGSPSADTRAPSRPKVNRVGDEPYERLRHALTPAWPELPHPPELGLGRKGKSWRANPGNWRVCR